MRDVTERPFHAQCMLDVAVYLQANRFYTDLNTVGLCSSRAHTMLYPNPLLEESVVKRILFLTTHEPESSSQKQYGLLDACESVI